MATIREEENLPKEEAPMENIGFDLEQIDGKGEDK